MAYLCGEGRSQGTLFPVILDDLVPCDHVCRVIDAFVDRLSMSGLGFGRAEAAGTGRPGYDPRDLLKLYLYGYLHRLNLEGLSLLSDDVSQLPRELFPCAPFVANLAMNGK